MTHFNRLALGAIMIGLGFGGTVGVRAQEPLQRVKDLYSSAAYEAALSAAGGIDGSASTLEVEHYRILCLVALGRTEDAERAIEALIMKRPLYRPEAAETPPRIQQMFTIVRRRVAPAIAKSMYVDGKAAFERKDRAAAVQTFESLMRIADDADLREDAATAEIRVLASGFLTLSKALPTAPEEPRHDAAAPLAPPAGPTAAQVVPPRVEAPVPIREVVPTWASPDGASRRRAFEGAVRVSIGLDGSVSAVELVQSVHPYYDGLLLRAAENWKYQPGRVNGKPVPSERVVKVRFKAQES